MTFSDLYEIYGGFRTPTFTLQVSGKTLDVGRGVRLERLECRLTTQREAGSLTLAAELEPGSEGETAWLEAVQLGAVCTLALGYRRKEKTVFSGFVYEAVWDDPLGGSRILEMTSLDVRGQLMLSCSADAGAARTLGQLVKTLLDQSCCTRMAEAKIQAIPSDWDLPVARGEKTDFSFLCGAADWLCYEFYAFGTEAYFGPARPRTGAAVIFSGPNGLIRLRRRRTLAGQCAAVAVSGADDTGARIYARAARARDVGVGVKSAASALALDLHQAEPAVRTMAQARYLARERMRARQRRGDLLLGRCTGLPDLRPGRFVEIAEVSEAVNGSFYLRTVVHLLDERGFETRFEAEE